MFCEIVINSQSLITYKTQSMMKKAFVSYRLNFSQTEFSFDGIVKAFSIKQPFFKNVPEM